MVVVAVAVVVVADDKRDTNNRSNKNLLFPTRESCHCKDALDS